MLNKESKNINMEQKSLFNIWSTNRYECHWEKDKSKVQYLARKFTT